MADTALESLNGKLLRLRLPPVSELATHAGPERVSVTKQLLQRCATVCCCAVHTVHTGFSSFTRR